MDANEWRGPRRRATSSTHDKSQKPLSRRTTPRGTEHRSRELEYQSTAARSSYADVEDKDIAKRGGCAASSTPAEVAPFALRRQDVIERCLARLLAGLTLQWHDVIKDLSRAHIPFDISDATVTAAAAAATSPLGSPTPTRDRHGRLRHRSSSVLRPRLSALSDSSTKTVASTSYLTQELHFNVHGREEVWHCGQCPAPSASSLDVINSHPYNCARGSATNSQHRKSWDCLTPATHWIPYLVKDGAEEHYHAHTGVRRDPHENDKSHTSSSPHRCYSHGSRGSGEGGDVNVIAGTDENAEGQLQCAALLGAAQSVEATMHGMRRVCDVLSAMSSTLRGLHTDRGSSKERLPSPLWTLTDTDSPCKRTNSAFSDANGDVLWAQTRGHYPSRQEKTTKTGWRSHESYGAHRQQLSATASVENAHHGKRSHRRCGDNYKARRAVSAIPSTPAPLPSKLHRQRSSPGDSPPPTAAAPTKPSTTPVGVSIYPAPPPSERVHIYTRSEDVGHRPRHSVDHGESAAASMGFAVLPPSHGRWALKTSDTPTTASEPHVHRETERRETRATAPIALDAADVISEKLAASVDRCIRSPSKTTTQASPTRLAMVQTVTDTARHALQGRWTTLLQEEGEARLRIAMSHNTHLLSILRGHYYSLRELERGCQQYSLTSEDEAARRRFSDSITEMCTSVTPATTDHLTAPPHLLVTTPPSFSLSVPSDSSGLEVNSEVTLKLTTPPPPPPTLDRQDCLDGKRKPNQISPTPTSAAGVVMFNRNGSPSLPQSLETVEKKNDALNTREDVTPSSAAVPAPLRTPRLLTREVQLYSPPLVSPLEASQRSQTSAALGTEHTEDTPPMTRQRCTRPLSTATRLLISPLEGSEDEMDSCDMCSDVHSIRVAVNISGSSAIRIRPENTVHGSTPSGVTAIAVGHNATTNDCTPPPTPPLGENADGAHRGQNQVAGQSRSASDSGVLQRTDVATVLFPTDAIHNNTPPAPWSSSSLSIPSPRFSPVRETHNGRNIEAADTTDVQSFSSLSSFHNSARDSQGRPVSEILATRIGTPVPTAAEPSTVLLIDR